MKSVRIEVPTAFAPSPNQKKDTKIRPNIEEEIQDNNIFANISKE